jgi:DUF1680 family protein
MQSNAIRQSFWDYFQRINRTISIFHQWDQLEASGCIDNFRILAENKPVFREGWFFADSDAYKWLEAASRIIKTNPDARLITLVDRFITLIKAAQDPDGYIFTYNQIHFPGTRWVNLQIAHELYCHGHLIEAGVSHHLSTGQNDLLDLIRLAADRIVADFMGKGPTYTPGHEEIEIGLLRLFEVTSHPPYLQLARQFLEQRGRDPLFALHLLEQNIHTEKRNALVKHAKQRFSADHPEYITNKLPPGNYAKKACNSRLRWYTNALSGKFLQQHCPNREQTVPVGHAVRFAYLKTASAMLSRLDPDHSLIPILEASWEHMVSKRMYITGGIGSLPDIEGFGRDYELDPELAYCETCAALGSIFWSWEMAQMTNQACYSDLLEWQLYNAALVGMGLGGKSFLYNNPLASHGNITRKSWFAVPCCPSNLSRTIENLTHYAYTKIEQQLFIHQYFDTDIVLPECKVAMRSVLPFSDQVSLTIQRPFPTPITLNLRHPSWSPQVRVLINDSTYETFTNQAKPIDTASGYDPCQSDWINLDRVWQPGDTIKLIFDMPIKVNYAHPRVNGHQSKVALSCGPMIYCLESIDNPGIDLFNTLLETRSLQVVPGSINDFTCNLLQGVSSKGEELKFIPYFLWANRGESLMSIWVKGI